METRPSGSETEVIEALSLKASGPIALVPSGMTKLPLRDGSAYITVLVEVSVRTLFAKAKLPPSAQLMVVRLLLPERADASRVSRLAGRLMVVSLSQLVATSERPVIAFTPSETLNASRFGL